MAQAERDVHDDYLWNGAALRGLCGHCQIQVDSSDPNHRVTSIMRGGRGVECVLRGDIEPSEGGPLRGAGPGHVVDVPASASEPNPPKAGR